MNNKTHLLLLLYAILIVGSCKKEEQATTAFQLPHTYKLTTTPSMFEVYNNGKILQPNTLQPNDILEFKSDIIFIDSTLQSITLKPNNVISMDGNPDCQYFFKSGILFVVFNSDTIAFASGDYHGFNSFYNHTYYTSNDSRGGSRSFGNSTLSNIENNVSDALKTCHLTSLSDVKLLDTLALHSIVLNYK